MVRPKRQDARRADLVEAALSAVSERGLRSISLTDVAQRAGLTRGAILYYYSDLDELLVEAHRAGVERFCDARDDLIASLDDPRDQLAVAIRAGLPDGPDDALMRLLYEFDILAGTSALHDEMVERMYRRQLATYTGVLQRGLDLGVFVPTLDLPTLAMTLVALEDSYGLHIVGGNSLITVDDAEQAMRRVSGQLGAPAEKGHIASEPGEA
ncbi:TetR/AcrR family transcriptional regulator [Microbacterium sp. NPDC058345]|uniref:TetR/AcrR family transcriptional regulator n=1 Tax=Microbacterium sp. NPDC058345 TaxID=3346455 RepID=UPI00365CAB1A